MGYRQGCCYRPCGASAWYGAAMLVGQRDPPPHDLRGVWDLDDLSTLAPQRKALRVGAYDEEGCLLWLSRGLSVPGMGE